MEAINQLQGKVLPLNRPNVDTDQIIPKQFLKRVEKSGFGQYLFYHWRYDDDGNVIPEFELNNPKYEGASILVAGNNFGCGSSREHAPWSLLDYGLKVIISSSFADIFYNNCVKNGILPIVLKEAEVELLIVNAQKKSDYKLDVDLKKQIVFDQDGFTTNFSIDSYWKEMLLNGWDEVSRTLLMEEKINNYENQQEERVQALGIQ
jgi:3-isopropylmalate/(R)-2-methylmalate dehydratase small subunit